MNLQQTVSTIQGQAVTEEEAKEFALNQFGVLSAFIRNKYLDGIITARNRKKRVFGTKKKSENNINN